MKTMQTDAIKNTAIGITALILSVVAVITTTQYTLLIPFVALLTYLAYRSYESNPISRYTVWSIFIAVLGLFIYQSIKTTVPNDFDFSCFYLYGSVTAHGLDYYNPLDFAKLVDTGILPHAISPEFKREVIEVGCPYPPPTVFLFLPLGYFNYHTALVLWKVFHTLIALGSVLLLANIISPTKQLKHYAFAGSLLLIAQPAFSTVLFCQTVFLLMFLVLLSYKYRKTLWGGIFLSLAIFVKPFVIILLLWFVISKLWKSFWGFALGCLVIFIATVIYTGIDPFFEYLLNNPALRQPMWLFNEVTNQSSLATLLRMFPERVDFATQLYYVINAIMATLAVLFLIHIRKHKNFTDFAWLTLMSGMLIFYPSGQLFYNLIHIMSLLILLKHIKTPIASTAIIFACYLMQYKGLFFTSSFMFLSTLFIAENIEPKLLGLKPIKMISSGFNNLLGIKQ